MITITVTNLQHISDFGLITIIDDVDRYAEETLVDAARVLECRHDLDDISAVRWNGREIVIQS